MKWWWWRRQIVAIEDYPYAGIDFRGDPNMPLPPGLAYGDIGNESQPLLFLKKFEVFNFFLFSWLCETKKTCFCVTTNSDIYDSCADVEPRWPEGFPRHRRRGRGDEITGADAEWTLQRIHTKFVWLTHRVPMAQVEDLPEAMQQQVVDVPRAWVRSFRRLARAVVTYHDHNPPPQD